MGREASCSSSVAIRGPQTECSKPRVYDLGILQVSNVLVSLFHKSSTIARIIRDIGICHSLNIMCLGTGKSVVQVRVHM